MNLLRVLPAALLCLPLIACGGTSSTPDTTVGKSVADALLVGLTRGLQSSIRRP